jgi:hypothetical protein
MGRIGRSGSAEAMQARAFEAALGQLVQQTDQDDDNARMGDKRSMLVIVVLALVACSQKEREVDQYSTTAQLLAARVSESVTIDREVAAELDAALIRVRELAPEAPIQAVPQSFLRSIMVSVVDSRIADRWRKGRTRTGDRYLDQLASEYGLATIEHMKIGSSDWFSLEFDRSLNLARLTERYEQSPHIAHADINAGWIGGCQGLDGNMAIIRKEGVLHLVFGRGWGDCPAGCANCEYFYFTVSDGGVQLVDQIVRGSEAESYRWNIPPRYPATWFASLDDLLAHFDHEDWWKRCHAIEAAGQLLMYGSPRFGEDRRETPHWQTLRNDAMASEASLLSRLQAACGDGDADVQAAARGVLARLSERPTLSAAAGESDPPAPPERSHRRASPQRRPSSIGPP